MKNICVFCGAHPGNRPEYAQAATQMGHALGQNGYDLVFGAGSVGLMGIVATAALKKGSKAIGVIPDFLEKKELAHKGLTELIIVSSMHERKQKMADLSDAFVALPGGIGTLEELCEILTWAQLGLHSKPFGLLNTAGYYDAFIQFFDHMVAEGFLPTQTRERILIEEEPASLLDALADYQPVFVDRWMNREQT